MSCKLHLAAAVLALAAASLSAQVAVNDLFDRANSTNLGPDWTEQDGDGQIVSNRLQGNSPFALGWCTHNVFAANYASTVVRLNWSMNGGGGDRISLIAGVDPNTWQGIEVRIADNNGDGTADRLFFNAAVNAGNWYTSPSFANLTTPLVAGVATMWFTNAGNTVNIELFDPATQTAQTYSASGILALPPTGTRVGIGYFGNGTVDDFQAWTGVPSAPAFTMTTPRTAGAVALLVTGAAPSATVVLAYSGTGNAPFPTSVGNVYLSLPIEILATLNADLTGRLAVPLGTLPPGLTGVVVHTQAFDATALALTNHFTVTIL